MDLLVLASITSVIIPKSSETKECSKQLFFAGLGITCYNVFFVLRNVAICIASYFSKNPLTNSTIARIGFICIDCIGYTLVVIWATMEISSEEASTCKEDNENIE